MSSANDYFQQGLQCRDRQEWQAAVTFYQKAITIQPNQAIYYCHLSEALLALQETINAISSLEIALKLEPQTPIKALIYWLLGNAYRQHEWTELAFQAYQTALTLDPDGFTIDAHLFMGDIYGDRHQYTQAHSAYQQALIFDEQNPISYSRILQNYLKQNDLSSASMWLEKIQSIDQELVNPKDVVDLGIKYLELKEIATAENLFHQSITIDPTYAPAHYYLGKAFALNQQLKEAILSYQSAVDLDPSFAPAYEELGQILMQINQPEAAIACQEAYAELIKMQVSN